MTCGPGLFIFTRMNTQQSTTQSEKSQHSPHNAGKEAATATVLPRQRAFVVQLSAQAAPSEGHVSGRVEHIASSSAAHFASWADLEAFMTTTLQTLTACNQEGDS